VQPFGVIRRRAALQADALDVIGKRHRHRADVAALVEGLTRARTAAVGELPGDIGVEAAAARHLEQFLGAQELERGFDDRQRNTEPLGDLAGAQLAAAREQTQQQVDEHRFRETGFLERARNTRRERRAGFVRYRVIHPVQIPSR